MTVAAPNRPDAPDVPVGGVPRHASRDRRQRGLKPFLADLAAGRLARGETAQEAPVTGVPEPAVDPAPSLAGAPTADGVTLAIAALATADHAGAAAQAAHTAASAAREEAAAARADAAQARTAADRADARSRAAHDEVRAAHDEYAALRATADELRAEIGALRRRAGRQVAVAWAGTGAAVALAVLALALG